MASLVADIAYNGCQGGAGLLTLSSASPAPGAGPDLSYYWSVLDSAGTDFGIAFDPATLPIPISGLPNGPYTTQVTASDNASNIGYASRPFNFVVACGPALVLDYATPTHVTATAAGAIAVGASGGGDPLLATLVELGLSQVLQPAPTTGQLQTAFGNIPAGTYTVRVTDSSTPVQQVQLSVTVLPYVVAAVMGCTDPSATNYDPAATQDDDSCVYAPPVRTACFEVPPMQSLRFVQPTRLDKPAFDNTLLADEAPLDYTNPGYCQKVEQGDTLVIQILSNYQGVPVLTIRESDTNNVALTVPAVQVQKGAGITADFEVYAKADPVAGFTRIYFNADALPLPFLPGQRITISATNTALDGTYPIQSVLEDLAAAVPYLRLAKPYPSGMLRLDGVLTTTYVVQQYDTYHAVIDFAPVAPGCYYAEITATDTDFADALAVSEPIDVAATHRHTKLLVYRNFDNAHGLNYTAGLVNRIRIEGRFFDRKPLTEKQVLRNDDRELVLLTAAAYQKVELETLLLPGWLHEVIAVAFCHDYTKLAGVEVILEGDYTYEDVERYTLGKGTALLEIKKFLGAGNRDDLGDVNQGARYLLTASDKHLLATP